MANSLISNYGSLVVGDNTTRFISIRGAISSSHSTEAFAEIPIRDAGVFSNLFCYVAANSATVTSTVTLRKSVAATALTVSYTSTQTGIKEDTSNTVTFVATDEADWEITVPNTFLPTFMTITVLGTQFAPTTTTDCISYFTINGSSTFSTASQTVFGRVIGISNYELDESLVEYRVRSSFTSSDFYTYVSANARTTNIVYGTRINSLDGNQTVTYTSGQTGAKEDTANTDSLVAGDDFNYYRITGTGTESTTMKTISSSIINTANIFPLVAGNEFIVPTVTTEFSGVAGRLLSPTNEAATQIYPRFTFTAKELVCYVSANAETTDPVTVTVRDNGADSTITVTYTGSQTGLKNDSSNTSEITSGTDEINYELDHTGSVGNITFSWVGILGTTAVETVIKDMISAGSGMMPFLR